MSDASHRFHVVCCICGESRITVGPIPSLGIDFMAAIDAVGFVYLSEGARILAFCCDEHAKAALTKEGLFRRRLPRLPRVAPSPAEHLTPGTQP